MDEDHKRNGMPSWLEALAQTSLYFWKDAAPLAWDQAVAMLPATGLLYTLARSPFAGEETFLTAKTLVVFVEVVVAVVLLLAGGRLGALSGWAPKFVRLLAVHLNLVLPFLAVNLLWPWASYLPNLFLVAVAANVLATFLLVFSTLMIHRPRATRELVWLCLIAAVLIATNSVIVRYSVLPLQAAEL